MDWDPNRFPLFLTHLAVHRGLVSSVKDHFLSRGIHGFVAHSDIRPSRAWQDEIEAALTSCEALAAFLHPGAEVSDWISQEMGFAYGRGVKILPLHFGLDPWGFVSRFQAPRCLALSDDEVADVILDCLLDDPRTRHRVEDGLIEAFVTSPSFAEARARFGRLDRVESWDWFRLDRVDNSRRLNTQVAGAWGVSDGIEKLLESHDFANMAPF